LAAQKPGESKVFAGRGRLLFFKKDVLAFSGVEGTF
jgi:hypothetical protein